jgi:actin related protein 2/3 complex subunit 5
VIDIFSATKQTEIPNIVKGLSIEQQNVLVKYIYKGMDSKKGQHQGGILLAWYEKTVDVTGMGPVVRYLTDRRTV